MMASNVHQDYELPDGARLTIAWTAERPASQNELDLLARLAQIIERHQSAGAGDAPRPRLGR
jgi:hypothetical protein